MSKHLVILTPGFPQDEEDSSCIPPLQDFVKALSRTKPDWKISVISFQYPYRHGQYEWNGLQVFATNGQNGKGWKKLYTWIRVWRHLRKIHKKFPIALIHSFWLGECAMLAKYFGKRYRIPHLCTLMGQDARPGNRYFSLKLKPQQLVCLTAFHQHQLEKSSGIRAAHLIPWGISPESFPEINTANRDIDLLGVGSLIPNKNYLSLLKSILSLKQHYPELKACIIGDGIQREELENYIFENNLETTVSMKGSLDRKEVFQYMNRSKILFHPSEYESFGMVIIEALYMGMYLCCPRPTGIAHPMQNWKALDEKSLALDEIPQAFLSGLKHSRIQVPTIQQNVDAYVQLYEGKLS